MLNIAKIEVIRAVFDSFDRRRRHFVNLDRRVSKHIPGMVKIRA